MKINPSIAINENGFLFDPNSGESFTTNPVGRDIIFMMKRKAGEAEIMAEILNQYDVDEITLEKNLIDFYAMLRYYHLTDEQ